MPTIRSQQHNPQKRSNAPAMVWILSLSLSKPDLQKPQPLGFWYFLNFNLGRKKIIFSHSLNQICRNREFKFWVFSEFFIWVLRKEKEGRTERIGTGELELKSLKLNFRTKIEFKRLDLLQ